MSSARSVHGGGGAGEEKAGPRSFGASQRRRSSVAKSVVGSGDGRSVSGKSTMGKSTKSTKKKRKEEGKAASGAGGKSAKDRAKTGFGASSSELGGAAAGVKIRQRGDASEVNLNKMGALTSVISRDAVSGKTNKDEAQEGLSDAEKNLAWKRRRRLEEILAKIEAEKDVDPMLTKKCGLLAKMRDYHSLAVSCCAYTDDGSHIVSGSFDGSVVVADIKHQRVKRKYVGHAGQVNSVSWNPLLGNKLLATSSSDSSVRVWEKKTGRCKVVLHKEHKHAIYSAKWSPNGRQLVTAGEDRDIIVWDIDTAIACADDPGVSSETLIDYKIFGAPLNSQGHTGPIRSAIFTSDGKQIISVSDDSRMKWWDLGETGGGVVSRSIKAHAGSILNLRSNHDGSKIITCSRDGTAKVWWTKSGLPARSFIGHSGTVYDACFTPEGGGRRVVTCGHDAAIIVWDASTGLILHRMSQVHRSYILGLSVRFDGRQIASASGDRTVGIWRALSPTKWEKFKETAGDASMFVIRTILESAGLKPAWAYKGAKGKSQKK